MAGFFKKALSGEGSLSPQEEMKEAIAFFIVLMIYADGFAEDAEIATAINSMARCGLYGNNNSDQDLSLLARMERKMNQDEVGNTRRYADVLTHDDWSYTAAAIMVDIMLADGDIDVEELALLQRVTNPLGVGNEELEAMIATVRVLRRPWQG